MGGGEYRQVRCEDRHNRWIEGCREVEDMKTTGSGGG